MALTKRTVKDMWGLQQLGLGHSHLGRVRVEVRGWGDPNHFAAHLSAEQGG